MECTSEGNINVRLCEIQDRLPISACRALAVIPIIPACSSSAQKVKVVGDEHHPDL